MSQINNLNINGKYQEQFKSLYNAVKNGSLINVNDILKLGNDINMINSETGFGLLHVACINKDADMVKLLIDTNANLNIKVLENLKPSNSRFVNKTSLFISVYNVDTRITELLLTNDAVVKEEPNILLTAVGRSLDDPKYVEDSISIIKLLLKYNANINCVNVNGYTPLHFAILGHRSIADLLFEHNPDINAVNKYDEPPLHFAILKNDYTLVEKLLKYHANIDAVDRDGNTALHRACRDCAEYVDNQYNLDYLDTIRVLLQYNADVNIKNRKGFTPLHVAAYYCSDNFDTTKHIQMVEMLLTHKANINSIDDFGDTPLGTACAGGNSFVTHVLLKHNADMYIKNFREKTPIDLAIEYQQRDALETMLNKVVDIDCLRRKNKAFLDSIQEDINSAVITFKENNITDENWPELFEYKAKYIIISYVEAYRILRHHIIKLKCAKHKISEHDVESIYTPDAIFQESIDYVMNNNITHSIGDVSEVENECNEEINKLKREKIGCTNLYNLLTRDIHDVAKWVKHKQINQVLESDHFEYTSPLYGGIIKTRFSLAIIRNELLQIALKYVPFTILNKLPSICVDHVFRYFNLKDLRIFIDTYE